MIPYKNLVYNISFKKFLLLVISTYSVVLAVLYVLSGHRWMFDIYSLIITSALACSIGVFVLYAQRDLFVQVSLFVVFCLIFIFPRILSYVIFPDKVQFPFGGVITSNQLNFALGYLLLGALAIMAGFLIADRTLVILKNEAANDTGNFCQFRNSSLTVVFFVTIAVNLFIQSFLGVNFLSKLQADKYNMFIQFLLLLFNADITFFMMLVALIINFKVAGVQKRTVTLLSFISVIYIALIAFYGSRSVGLRLLNMFLVIALTFNWKFKAHILRYASVICILLVLSLVLYPLVTQIRLHRASRFNYGIQDKEVKVIRQPGSTTDEAGLGLFKDLERFFFTVTSRLGIVDYEIAVLTQGPDERAREKFISVPYITKNIVNMLIPGVPYPEATLSTSRLVTVLYRGFSEEYVKTHGYFSEYYTPWGIFYLLFGWWPGLGALFLSAFLIHGFYLVARYCMGSMRHYWGSLYLLIVPFLFYGNCGIDHWISNSVLLGLSGVFAIGFFYVFDQASRSYPVAVSIFKKLFSKEKGRLR